MFIYPLNKPVINHQLFFAQTTKPTHNDVVCMFGRPFGIREVTSRFGNSVANYELPNIIYKMHSHHVLR